MFNEEKKIDEILRDLSDGKIVAVVTDAGYPGISDPGYLIGKRAQEAGCNVTTLPGASASITALVGSGLDLDKFYFYGFLNHDLPQKKKEALWLPKDIYNSLISNNFLTDSCCSG